MKRTLKILLTITILILSLVGCTEKANIKSQLVGAWYQEGTQEATLVLYDDGTCEIAGEYGTGTWSVVNDKLLKLTNYYGEVENANIISIENNCLTLGDEYNKSQFWNSPQGTNYESQEIEDEDISIDSSDYADTENANLIGLYQMKDYTLYNYIAGAAIIDYKIGDERIRALIDREGSFISELGPETFFTSDRDLITGACYSDQKVVDVEGNIIFTVEDGQRILCVGDSMILVYEKAVGFEKAESKIGVVSFDGEWLQPMTSDNLMIDDEKTGLRYSYCWRYAGEGCFLVDNDQYSNSPGLVMNKYETVIFDVYNKTSSIYSGKLTYGFCDGVTVNARADIFIDHLGNIVKETSDSNDPIGDGMYYNSSQRTLCRYSGEIIKDYNQYKNAWVTVFKDGHGYFEAEGADGNHYFSVIDSNGDFLFDPIQIHRERYGFMGGFYNGEFIADEKSFDLFGNIIFDFSEIASLGGIASCREGIAIVKPKQSKGKVYMTMHGEVIEPMIPQK